MYKRFELNDLVFFHKIVHEHLPFKMPQYIIRYNGSSRLRDNRLDSLSYIFNTTYINSNPRSALYKGFFYRTLYAWNKLLLIPEIPLTKIYSKSILKSICGVKF